MSSCCSILIGIWHIRNFFFTFRLAIKWWTWETSMTGKCSYVGEELTFVAAKVSLMLDNPFLVPSLCKLNHISVCLIHISTKSPANSLFPSGKAMFFWSHPRCFGPLGKFQHNIKISIKTTHVSKLSVSYDYGGSNISGKCQ